MAIEFDKKNRVQKQESPDVAAATDAQRNIQLKGKSFSEQQAALTPSNASDFDAQMNALKPPTSIQMKGGHVQQKNVHEIAAQGTQGSGSSLPFGEQIQAAFGQHDVSNVQAYTGGAAANASDAIGAQAFASGNNIAFKSSPDLHTAAHEAAHVVQQRAGVSLSGGVGKAGDHYEQHADKVADRVVQGKSAEDLLDKYAGGSSSANVQKKPAVQCYSKVPGVGSVSTDKKAIKAGKRTLYAHESIINEGNAKLQGAGKEGSFVKLMKKGPKQKHGGNTLHQVIPEWVSKGAKAGEHAGAEKANQPGGKDTAGSKSGGHGFALWTDCGRSSAAVTGAQNRGDRSVVYNDNGKQVESHGKRNDGSVAGWMDTAPGGMANEIYFQLIPKFIANPANRAFLSDGEHYNGKPSPGNFITPRSIQHAKVMYAELTDKGKDKFDSEAGINHHANPEIGQAYSMATEGQMPGFKETGPMTWNYHWAGVIAKAGTDNITLENFAVTSDTAKKYGVSSYDFVDRDWNFDMYGTEDESQTFHQEHLDSNTHGSHATSIAVKSDD